MWEDLGYNAFSRHLRDTPELANLPLGPFILSAVWLYWARLKNGATKVTPFFSKNQGIYVVFEVCIQKIYCNIYIKLKKTFPKPLPICILGQPLGNDLNDVTH